MSALRLVSALFALFIAPMLMAYSPQTPEDIASRVDAAIKVADESVAKIIAVPQGQRTYENTLGALDDLQTRLDTETSLLIFMQNVSTEAAVRNAARAADEKLSGWYVELGKREDLYNAVKAFSDSKPKLDGERARLLEFTMRDYRRAGMDLPKDKREELKAIELELTKLGIEFDQGIADDETVVPLTLDELRGVPADAIERQPKAMGLVLYKLDGPSYDALMTYCQVPSTRQRAWVSYRRRGGMKNVATLQQLLKLRAKQAELLGYANTVDYQIETRMAKNSQTVKKFYDDLRPLVREKALVDMREFVETKRKDTKDPKATLNPWDYAFYKNLLQRDKYSVDSEKVREYFPLQSVVDGMFAITSSLYGVQYRDVTSEASKLGLPVWQEDVKLYEVSDRAGSKALGYLYMDLYPRPGKYTHAACWGLRARKVWSDGTVQLPLAALVTNFTRPTSDKPSLLPHDEVETLFHEFGHGLHNLLTNVSVGRFSGTSVARDFVEAPSQMMENWVWEPSILANFAKHYKTGQPLPAKMLEGMIRARTLGSGIETMGQLFLGQMDQRFHLAPKGEVDTVSLEQEIYGQETLYKPVPNTYYEASFGHLNGYQGAYYGYLWSLVYAQDMFQRFKELGLTSPEAGMYYRTKVLARGGTMDEMPMLKDYLGREPKMDAFLAHLGLKRAKP